MSERGEPDLTTPKLKPTGSRGRIQADFNPAKGTIVIQTWLETVYEPYEVPVGDFLEALGLTVEDAIQALTRRRNQQAKP